MFWQERPSKNKAKQIKLFAGILRFSNSTIGGDQSESRTHNAAATAFGLLIHRSRWVDNPELIDLIGKTNFVGTAIAVDVAKG